MRAGGTALPLPPLQQTLQLRHAPLSSRRSCRLPPQRCRHACAAQPYLAMATGARGGWFQAWTRQRTPLLGPRGCWSPAALSHRCSWVPSFHLRQWSPLRKLRPGSQSWPRPQAWRATLQRKTPWHWMQSAMGRRRRRPTPPCHSRVASCLGCLLRHPAAFLALPLLLRGLRRPQVARRPLVARGPSFRKPSSASSCWGCPPRRRLRQRHAAALRHDPASASATDAFAYSHVGA